MADPVEGRRGPVPSLFIDQTEGQRAEFFWDRIPLLSQGLDNGVPPALSEGPDLPLYFTYWISIETVLVSGSIGAVMHTAATFGILIAELKKHVSSSNPGQVDFLAGQVTFKADLPIGQGSRKVILQLNT